MYRPLLKVLQILLAARTVIAALMWLLVVTWDKSSSFYGKFLLNYKSK